MSVDEKENEAGPLLDRRELDGLDSESVLGDDMLSDDDENNINTRKHHTLLKNSPMKIKPNSLNLSTGLNNSGGSGNGNTSLIGFDPPESYGADGLPIESFDFQAFESEVFLEKTEIKTEREFQQETVARWTLTFFIGACVAAAATVVAGSMHYLLKAKFGYLYGKIEGGEHGMAFLFYMGVNVGLALVGSSLTMFVEPVAAGSGIPEVKALLNGMKIPRAVRIKTLFVKILGLICAVGAGLPVGKEGPMIHIGSIVAAGLSQGKSTSCGINTSWTKFQAFRNDMEKRDFIACGASAGIASAFAAPIGGVLYSLEEGSSFWHQALTFRTFFCTLISTTMLALFFSYLPLGEQKSERVSGMFTFGDFNESDQNKETYKLWELPFFMIIGVLGGLLGAYWVKVNHSLMKWRKRHVRTPLRKIGEALVITGVVSAVMFGFAYSSRTCYSIPEEATLPQMREGYVQLDCPEKKFSETATLFLNNSEDVIYQLFHSTHQFSFLSLTLFFVIHLTLYCWTAGIAMPTGLFIPSILAGAAMGRFFGQILSTYLSFSNPGTYALMGSAAFVGGITRITISLAVMLIEATGNIQYGLPLMLVVMVAKFPGDFFNEGIYNVQIAFKRWAFLEPDPPYKVLKMRAWHVMNTNFQCLPQVCTVAQVMQALIKSSNQNMFPIILPEPEQQEENNKQKQQAEKNQDGKENNQNIIPVFLTNSSSSSTSTSTSTSTTSSQFATSQSPSAQVMITPVKSLGSLNIETSPTTDRDYQYLSTPHSYPSSTPPRTNRAYHFGVQPPPYTGPPRPFRGIILKKHLITILHKRAWWPQRPVMGSSVAQLSWDDFESTYPRYPQMKDLDLQQDDVQNWVDLTPYMHKTPVTIFEFASLKQVYVLFRTLGLRHLCVLDQAKNVIGIVTRKSLTLEHVIRKRLLHHID